MQSPSESRVAQWVAALLQSPHRVYWALNKLQFVAGVLLVVLGAVAGQRLIPALLEGRQVQGTIVGYQQVQWLSTSSTGSQHHSPFMPVVEFVDPTGVHRFQDVVGTSSNGGVGDRVLVLVNPRDPEASVIHRGLMNWIPWAPMLGLGVLLLLSGVLGLRNHRWDV